VERVIEHKEGGKGGISGRAWVSIRREVKSFGIIVLQKSRGWRGGQTPDTELVSLRKTKEKTTVHLPQFDRKGLTRIRDRSQLETKQQDAIKIVSRSGRHLGIKKGSLFSVDGGFRTWAEGRAGNGDAGSG